ncbi:MAG: hypothetical protein AzoDbin1_05161 [Azoarcus sp.]|nr:hypothetical protein [Azoarcus sp.]
MIDFLIFIIAAPLLIIAVLYLLEPDKKFFAAYILLPLLLTLAAIAKATGEVK